MKSDDVLLNVVDWGAPDRPAFVAHGGWVGSISAPTLLLHGEQDAIIPLSAAQTLRSRIPDATLVTLPQTGHVPTLTRPQDVVNAVDNWWSDRPV